MLSFFPRGVLDEILNLIESVSEGFPSYSCCKTLIRHLSLRKFCPKVLLMEVREGRLYLARDLQSVPRVGGINSNSKTYSRNLF